MHMRTWCCMCTWIHPKGAGCLFCDESILLLSQLLLAQAQAQALRPVIAKKAQAWRWWHEMWSVLSVVSFIEHVARRPDGARAPSQLWTLQHVHARQCTCSTRTRAHHALLCAVAGTTSTSSCAACGRTGSWDPEARAIAVESGHLQTAERACARQQRGTGSFSKSNRDPLMTPSFQVL